MSRRLVQTGAGLGLLAVGLTAWTPWGAAAALSIVAALACLGVAAQVSPTWNGLALTAWVCAFGSAALFFPAFFISWGEFELRQLIVPLIQIVMFGMGTTLTLEDFARVAKQPFGVAVGLILQFTIMPVGGWLYARLFQLDGLVAAGLILVGSCPGGVASNVIAYLARANVALSVTMTAVSTLLSPLSTPLVMSWLSGRYVPVEPFPMMASIVKMILVPVLSGVVLAVYVPTFTRWLSRWMPSLSVLSICFIIAVTVALSRDDLLIVGVALFGASVCHNATGYALGYGGAYICGLKETDRRTVAIEVGMQNGGMATGLAFEVLRSPQAAMASAVFGPWSALAGSVLASYWRRHPRLEQQLNQSERPATST